MSRQSSQPLTKRQNLQRMLRAERKRILIAKSAMQAKVAKAMLIIKLRGKNGMSMSEGLLKAHGLNAKAKGGEA